MAKYIRAVEAADKIAEAFKIPMGELVDVFAGIPAADVVPVVRCKGCKWYHEERGHFCDYHAASVSPDWFCWNGERKDGDDNAVD